MTVTADQTDNGRREAILFLVYYGLYLGYLFFLRLEGEVEHWPTLVLIPLLLIWLMRRRHGASLAETLGSVGLRRSNWTRWLVRAALLGLGLSIAQLFVSERSEQVLDLITSGKAAYLFPITFVLLLMTAGFTEEFFFRGILQTRLAVLTGGRWQAVITTSLLFGLYHLPYAYLHPRWSSHGDWGAASVSALTQGIIGGLILGAVYERSRHNLLASVLVHALINSLPAMTLVKFSVG